MKPKEIKVRSEEYGVDLYICLDRKSYVRRVLDGAICFSINEIETLVDEAPGADIIVDALALKAAHPGVKIVSFNERKCVYRRQEKKDSG